MRIHQTQYLGATAILFASLIIYGGAILTDQDQLSRTSIPWGTQGPGTKAVEVLGSRDSDGIYFIPDSPAWMAMLALLDREGCRETAGASLPLPAGIAFTLSVEAGRVGIRSMPAAKRLALGLPIDLNQASQEDLALVPGINEVLAAEIVQHRNMRGGRFGSLADLKMLRGIKEKKVQALMKYLSTEPVP